MNTPECNKMIAASAESQKIGAFIDWLGEQGYTICEAAVQKPGAWGQNPYIPTRKGIEQLLADYFEIDLDAVEVERRAILASLPVS